MKQYNLGFVFTSDYSSVLLVHKNRPDWQVGKLNGLGGKNEPNETSLEGMVRELEEESGLHIAAPDWVTVGAMSAGEWNVDVFTAVWTGDTAEAQTLTDEQIEWIPTNALPDNVMVNLRWLIPLAANKLQAVDELALASVQYRR